MSAMSQVYGAPKHIAITVDRLGSPYREPSTAPGSRPTSCTDSSCHHRAIMRGRRGAVEGASGQLIPCSSCDFAKRRWSAGWPRRPFKAAARVRIPLGVLARSRASAGHGGWPGTWGPDVGASDQPRTGIVLSRIGFVAWYGRRTSPRRGYPLASASSGGSAAPDRTPWPPSGDSSILGEEDGDLVEALDQV